MLKIPGDLGESPRYLPAGGIAGRAAGESVLRRVSGHVLSPIVGSRLIFPRYFDRAVARILANPQSPDMPTSYARWYFGGALRFAIDPARLDRRIVDYVEDGRGRRWMGASFLDAAEWEEAIAELRTSPIHREMFEVVAADLRFRDTHRYRLQAGKLARGKPIHRNGVALATLADLDAYYAYCVDLIKSVRDYGILPRDRVSRLGRAWLKHRDVRPAGIDTAERDIGVAIDERGTLIRHLGGKHRTAIAQALALPSIPVELRLVHVGWLSSEARRTALPAHLALGAALRRLAADPLGREWPAP
jgi:hypothetical protein